MLTYFDNQPFLDALAGQTAHVNQQSSKTLRLSIALGITAVCLVAVLIKIDRLRSERDAVRAGVRLREH